MVWGNCPSHGEERMIACPLRHSLVGVREIASRTARKIRGKRQKNSLRALSITARTSARSSSIESWAVSKDSRHSLTPSSDVVRRSRTSEEADRAFERGVGHAQRPLRGFGGRLGSAAESVSESIEFRKL
jgi:hypothetical protein